MSQEKYEIKEDEENIEQKHHREGHGRVPRPSSAWAGLSKP
jgi:hypothetical protein